MKSISFASILFAVLLGVALAWIQPAQPVQVAQETAPAFMGTGLDNPSITADPNIHPARKCKLDTQNLGGGEIGVLASFLSEDIF